MFAKKTIATVCVAIGRLVGGAAAAAPANAVGTLNGKCTYYDSFVGTSTATGNSSTSGQQSLCGNAKVRVGYTVSGGSAQYTPWKTASGMVVQGPVGYTVFGGEHTVTDSAIGVSPSLVRT